MAARATSMSLRLLARAVIRDKSSTSIMGETLASRLVLEQRVWRCAASELEVAGDGGWAGKGGIVDLLYLS
jgi:hypothetical protein